MPTTFHLSAQDALFSLSNHPLVHFFENKTREAEFMPTTRLFDALHCTLKRFPILTGYIREIGKAVVVVVVDESNPNQPELVETSSSAHYDTLREHQFNWNVWPSAVATAGPVTAPGKNGSIKLLSVHIVRLSGNSGLILFCNIPHYILDGFGYYEFLGHWGMLYRKRTEQPALQCSGLAPATPYIFDRALLVRQLGGKRKPLDNETLSLLTRKNYMAGMFARLPYKLQARLAFTALRFNHADGHYFHIPDNSLEELRRLYNSNATSTVDFNAGTLESYTMLTALFSTSIIQAFIRKSSRRNSILRIIDAILGHLTQTRSSSLTILNCVHAHKLLDINYVGNPVFIQPILYPLDCGQDSETASIFASIANDIYTRIGSVDVPLLGELHDALEKTPDLYAKLAMSVAMGQPQLTFIDEREYRVADVDFGCGGPSWVGAPQWNMPNFIAFLACPQGIDGAIVYASLKDEILESMLCNTFFMDYARLLF